MSSGSKPKVFVTREIPSVGLDMVRDFADAEVWPDQLPPEKSMILDKVKDCDGLLSLLTDTIDAEVIEAGKSLKVISNYAVGFNNIDIEAANARNIPVGNTPGVLTDTTADNAWALLMAIARRVVEGDKYVRAGQWKTWEPQLLLGCDVNHSTIGIIGFGRIGQAMAQRARGFDMRILYYDPYRNDEAAAEFGAEYRELDDLLKEADFVTLHCLLNEDTRHLIGAREFELMGPEAYLINNSRGGVVDTDALYDALANKKIRGAALDVTEPEPIAADHPMLQLNNVIINPHIASASRQTRGKMAVMAAENLIAGLKGESLPNCANPAVNY